MFKHRSPLTPSARMTPRAPVQPQASASVPAHVRAEWTGETARPSDALARIRDVLA
ncbi:hypothetical protein KIKIMORA_04530 [Brevundimonas phage vB_BpoS-Kikimora]|uniref:Uncharacterized protein n=1 Tax=Brevundimonas phage vB_BpoS-Kikimora TaxID=2948601 RepID=A0A9E7MRK8_9CAUD|nr:hypothetical protein KIKIMORA_04530 [Brevundimonas phage vB_BpoS-Kikimora]